MEQTDRVDSSNLCESCSFGRNGLNERHRASGGSVECIGGRSIYARSVGEVSRYATWICK